MLLVNWTKLSILMLTYYQLPSTALFTSENILSSTVKHLQYIYKHVYFFTVYFSQDSNKQYSQNLPKQYNTCNMREITYRSPWSVTDTDATFARESRSKLKKQKSFASFYCTTGLNTFNFEWQLGMLVCKMFKLKLYINDLYF